MINYYLVGRSFSLQENAFFCEAHYYYVMLESSEDHRGVCLYPQLTNNPMLQEMRDKDLIVLCIRSNTWSAIYFVKNVIKVTTVKDLVLKIVYSIILPQGGI